MDYSNIFYGILGWLGKAVIVIVAFHFGRYMSKIHKEKWKSYATVLGITIFLSLVMWGSYGTHVEEADPLFGGGEIVVDFEPTVKERNEYGLIIFFVLTIPALFGVYKGYREIKLQKFLKKIEKVYKGQEEHDKKFSKHS
jgi:Na+-driven multidrug efflux pump